MWIGPFECLNASVSPNSFAPYHQSKGGTQMADMTMEEFKAFERQEIIAELVREARAEDDREGSHFDRDGWGNFFLEDRRREPGIVEDAWRIYEREISTS
jgi:hypothetical protein